MRFKRLRVLKDKYHYIDNSLNTDLSLEIEITNEKQIINEIKKSGNVWLLNSEVEDVVFSICNNTIIWESGIWYYGVWKYGIFENGSFLSGTFQNGFMGENVKVSSEAKIKSVIKI